MYSVPQPQQTLDDLFSLRFESGPYSGFQAGGGVTAEQCGHADPIDHAALLLTVLGARTQPLGSAPTVAFAFPPGRAVLPPVLPLRTAVACSQPAPCIGKLASDLNTLATSAVWHFD